MAFTYASEVFPLVYREVGFGFSVMMNFLGLGLLLLLVPPFQMRGLGGTAAPNTPYWTAQSRIMGAFAVLNLVAFLLIFLFVPETAGTVIDPKHGKLNSMSLEELNYIFGETTTRHARYQIKEMLPWHFQKIRWIVCHLFTSKWHDPEPPAAPWMWVEVQGSTEGGNTTGGTEMADANGNKEEASTAFVEDVANEPRRRTCGTVDS